MYTEMGLLEEMNDSAENITMVDVFSDSDSNTTNEVTKKQKKMLEEIKKMDKGYHKIYRIIDNKKKSIEFYSSPIFPGSKIRGAIGGSYYPGFKVGSKDEDIFFKIAMSTGECKDNNICFFDTPEQFEQHMNATVSQSSKDKWYEKFNRERLARQSANS
uniref:Uncharacterized protein n=1 Tax=viral metagenome TaxID=1070528 RepID=A0A6C0D512_9ZZZZ